MRNLRTYENFKEDDWNTSHEEKSDIIYYNPSKDLYIVKTATSYIVDCNIKLEDDRFKIFPEGGDYSEEYFNNNEEELTKGYYPVKYDETWDEQMKILKDNEELGLL